MVGELRVGFQGLGFGIYCRVLNNYQDFFFFGWGRVPGFSRLPGPQDDQVPTSRLYAYQAWGHEFRALGFRVWGLGLQSTRKVS